ncbi:MAG: ABC transporter permease [Anaerolineales bacterium]
MGIRLLESTRRQAASVLKLLGQTAITRISRLGSHQAVSTLASIVISVLLAMLIGSVVMAVAGNRPLEVYGLLLEGAFVGVNSIMNSLQRATPLVFVSLAAVIAFRSDMFNLGIEGQFVLGALITAYVGFSIQGLPWFLHIPLALSAGALTGGLWALLPGLMKVFLNVNEVVSTIMFNYVAAFAASYMVNYPWRETPEAPFTPPVSASATIPQLVVRSQLNYGFFIAVGTALFFAFLLNRTTLGYELRQTGLATRFAQYGGISVKRVSVLSMVLSGAVAGLGGGVEILGVYRRYIEQFSVNLGFDGILVALLGKLSPVGAFFASVFYGGLKSGAQSLEWTSEVPRELIGTIVSIIIFFLAAEGLFRIVRSYWHARPQEAE